MNEDSEDWSLAMLIYGAVLFVILLALLSPISEKSDELQEEYNKTIELKKYKCIGGVLFYEDLSGEGITSYQTQRSQIFINGPNGLEAKPC